MWQAGASLKEISAAVGLPGRKISTMTYSGALPT
jgi:hypothetical protein